MEGYESSPAVVIDNGSGSIKAGFASESAPRAMFPSIVGVCRSTNRSYVGFEAASEGSELKYPIQRGVITDWTEMETLWYHTFFEKLHVDPQEYSVLHTEPPLNPKVNREKMTQAMFETFGTPAMFISMQGTLALYATSRTTGLVIDSGEEMTYTIPIEESIPITNCIGRLEMGGKDLTEFLVRMLNSERGSSKSKIGNEVATDIKLNFCYLSSNFEVELEADQQHYKKWGNRNDYAGSLWDLYKLPDGNIVTLRKERFACPEALFRPSLLGPNYEKSRGLSDMIFASLLGCESESLRKQLCKNVVLSGGNTLFHGFVERLDNELLGYPATSSLSLSSVLAFSTNNNRHSGSLPSTTSSSLVSTGAGGLPIISETPVKVTPSVALSSMNNSSTQVLVPSLPLSNSGVPASSAPSNSASFSSPSNLPHMSANLSDVGASQLPPLGKFKLLLSNRRQKLNWIGGSIVASLSTFSQMWVSKVEYDDAGPSIIHRKVLA